MAVTFRSNNNLVYGQNSSSVSVPAPATIVNGDKLLLVGVIFSATTASITAPTPPAGFVAVPGTGTGGLVASLGFLSSAATNYFQYYAWMKTASSESGNYSLTQGATYYSYYWIASMVGADIDNPMQTFATWNITTAPGGDHFNSTVTGVTSNRDGCRIIAVGGDNGDYTAALIAPTGMNANVTGWVVEVSGTGTGTSYIADAAVGTAGPTGDGIYQNNSTGVNAGATTVTLLIQPTSGEHDVSAGVASETNTANALSVFQGGAITVSQIEFHYSGSGTAANPELSLGGAIAGTIAPGTTNNVWKDVTDAERQSGKDYYSCIFVKNTHPSDTWQNVTLWIDDPEDQGTTSVGLDPGLIGGTAVTVANVNTAPTGVTFASPATKAAGTVIGGIPAGSYKAFWEKRSFPAGGSASASDAISVRVEGDTSVY